MVIFMVFRFAIITYLKIATLADTALVNEHFEPIFNEV